MVLATITNGGDKITKYEDLDADSFDNKEN